MTAPAALACAILAGGKATRLGGTCKALVPIAGRTILDRQLAVLRPLFGEVFLVANDPAPFAGSGIRIVPDRDPDLGPLGGIRAALLESPTRPIFIVAGDLPALDPRAIELLFIDEGGRPRDASALSTARGLEPLHALWWPSALRFVDEAIAARRLAVHEVLERMDTVRVPAARVLVIDPALAFLENVNTPEDVLRLSKRLAALPIK